MKASTRDNTMQPNSPLPYRLSDEGQENYPLNGSRQGRQKTLPDCIKPTMIAPAIFMSLLVIYGLTRTQPPARGVPHRLACSIHKEDCETTAPFIFDTVYSLLKQWPNTYGPNGHSIVAATIPLNTQLYHARPDGKPPKVPTFFAFDAYVCCIATCKDFTLPVTNILQRDVPWYIRWFRNTDYLHHGHDETVESTIL